MDPLSLTCSVVALTQAASSIASSLYTAFEALRTADERIASFCDEVQNLAGFLNAINKALTECGSMGMATVGEDLWRQSELTLKDIGTTLREMELLVNQIKENNTDGRPYGMSLKRRAHIAIDLKAHGTALLSFRDRILKSNWALQTILNTIAVSVSLRNSASQESILMALNKLKRSVDDAFHGTRQTDVSARTRTRDRFDVQMAQNLHKLAKAAQTFHTTASATASTIHGGSARVDLWDSPLGATVMSIAGDLSPFQRERIEGYIDGQMQHCLEEEAYSTLIPVLPESEFEAGDYERYTSVYNCDQQEHGYNMIDGDDDSELEKLFVDNLMELAENHIRDGKFARRLEIG
ncbi:hypothetical protein CMQ_5117 [Grosmannia clavigera kw1407]|uniref:Fungal N-terminal domain-containing protein n=1 Tax=Grosmannia clavigera (strain kw1407 / UAMH 11150) TaxID=655863 RepID=F0XBI7_GROCL|nr:uncharacterized protein CMQ_5117 [Grosmannia clavigera kw1407]EFX04855.1 hypothetical protein CMQ_5117 [Grosmannia clavigera kw1407]